MSVCATAGDVTMLCKKCKYEFYAYPVLEYHLSGKITFLSKKECPMCGTKLDYEDMVKE